jgi:hypothetical protein
VTQKFSSEDRVNFGGHKGKRWRELTEGYLYWIQNNMTHENIRAQAAHELEVRQAKKSLQK